MTDPTPSPASPSPMRGLVLRLVLAVTVVHGVAIALFYTLGIATASQGPRSIFVIAWVTVTLVVCSYFLRRIRLLRRGWKVKGRA